MNKFWLWIILISIAIGIANGNVNELTTCLFDSASSAVETCLNVFAIISLWSGIMKIAEKSGFINTLQKTIQPFMKIIFPEVQKNSPAISTMAMNIAANLIGVGNVATPLGIKAMEELQVENKNKNKLSKTMSAFLILNTASIQLIPSTVIAMRTGLGSENPTAIVFPIFVASFVSAIIGLLIVNLICK